MKIVAHVTTVDGPLPKGVVDVVSAQKTDIVRVGSGTVRDGQLVASADVGAVWGLWIDERPVVAFPVSSDGESVDLGEIVLVTNPITWPAFHAKDGRIHGLPLPARVETPVPVPDPVPVTAPTTPRVTGPAVVTEPLPTLKTRMTFGDMFGSTAHQLATVATALPSNFVLSGATVTLKGVPSAAQDALSLEFPTAEIAATGTGLSELSFSIRTAPETSAATPQTPARTRVPDLVGYTRELAARKAAAAGFVTELNAELTREARQVGRVVRQVPAAPTTLPPGGLIRLYFGKTGAS